MGRNLGVLSRLASRLPSVIGKLMGKGGSGWPLVAVLAAATFSRAETLQAVFSGQIYPGAQLSAFKIISVESYGRLENPKCGFSYETGLL